MATTHTDLTATGCPEKAEILRKITRTQTEIAELNRLEVKALIDGDREADTAIGVKLEEARQLRTELMADLRNHAERHRC